MTTDAKTRPASEYENELRETARGLLANGEVDVVIGYGRGSLPLRSTPVFIRRVEDADQLIWDATCTNNLAAYLPRYFRMPDRPPKEPIQFPTVAVVVKSCDGRAVAELIAENQVPRDHVRVIAMPCAGMIDVRAITPGPDQEIVSGTIDGDDVTVTFRSGEQKRLKVTDALRDICVSCRHEPVPVADYTIGEPVTPVSAEVIKAGAQRQAEMMPEAFAALSPAERWDYFAGQMAKCLRCYACRNACPLCYCKECFAESTRPRWLGSTADPSDTAMFHIGRIFHSAGRCLDCGACVAACPVGIDLRPFTRQLVEDVKELYDYEPGQAVQQDPALGQFKEDDPDEFL